MTPKEIYIILQKDIYGRANVHVRQTSNDQMVVLYDDHRWLLNVLFALNNHIECIPDLIYFDAHDDAAQCLKKGELLKQIGVEDLKSSTPKQFGAFVDYDQRIDDGGWLTTALELNLVSNVVNVGNRNNYNIEQMNGLYTSEDGIKHNVFELSENLEHELGRRGKLGDTYKESENRSLRDFFGIKHYYSNYHSLSINRPYVLDFDLDYFTISSKDEVTHGWTEKVFNNHFPNYSEQDMFLRSLIAGALVITICREPGCCGSIGDSNRILEILDRYYFEGTIGTDVTL